jgi:NAD(P)-dependent dehydrogenase (short-subunit alcohol dehydrogenase family)
MNQVIWITGGGSGIGQSLALLWAKQGHTVVISGRRLDKLEETIAQATKMPGRIYPLLLDVTDHAAVEACADKVVKEHGRMDVCVANAGFSYVGLFESMTPDDWHRQMDVNFFGAIWTMQAALKHLRKTKGRLAVISSVSGKLATGKTSAYSASKFALVGVCNALYQELYGSGVSVTSILPGLVESDIAKVDNKGVFHANYTDRRPQAFVYPRDKAARDIARAIEKRKREAVITGHGKVGVFLVNHFSGLLYAILRRAPIKRQR